ncbi:MAG: hypothetical protein U0797_04760 [Gemmataceae bacterium]
MQRELNDLGMPDARLGAELVTKGLGATPPPTSPPPASTSWS